MAIPTTLESLSTTAASNGPAGSEQRTLADDGLRQAYAFLAQVVQSGSDIASASTITPPSTGSSFHITGTTSITAIGSTNSWNGRTIILIFDGALTLTHSSNLALPGSVNITTVANDVALFRQNSSGAWRCLNYQPSDTGIQKCGVSTASGSDLTNCAVTPSVEQWSTNGSQVIVSGCVNVDPTASGYIAFSLSTPTNYTAFGTGRLAGVGTPSTTENVSTRMAPLSIRDNAANKAYFEGYANTDLAAVNVFYIYMYRVS